MNPDIFEFIFAHVAVGLLIVDRHGTILLANPAAQALCGLPADFAGKPLNVAVTPGRVTECEFTLADGKRVAAEMRVSAFEWEGDSVRLVSLHDVTELKRADSARSREHDASLSHNLAEHAHIEAELREQKQLFENLVAVARATTERLTLKETLRDTLTVAIRLTGAQGGDVFLLDKRGVVTDSVLPPGQAESEQRAEAIRWVMDRGLAGWVRLHREAALVLDTTRDGRWLAWPGDPYVAMSALAVPIMSGLVVVGVLMLTHAEPNHFSANHMRLLQAAADQMALALHNAQLFDEQHRMAERQATLYHVLRAVSGQLDPQAVVRTAVETIFAMTHWPHVSLAMPEDGTAQWYLAAASGPLSSAADGKLPQAGGVIGRACVTKRTQHVPDTRADPDYGVGHPAVRSELAVPLCWDERVLGVLNLESDQPGAFDASDVRLAESLAEAIALAMENARLYVQARRHAADLSALYTITLTTSQSLALEDVFDRALASALATLGFEAGTISLMRPGQDGLQLTAARGLPLTLIKRLRSRGLSNALGHYAFQCGECLAFSSADAPSALNELVQDMSDAGWSAFAAMPLWRGDQALGAMSLFARRSRSFVAGDLALLATVGQQVATAVSNALLFQATQDERGRLQALIKSSRDGVILVGTDGRLLVINAQALQMLGLPGQPEDWLRYRLRDVLSNLRVKARPVLKTLLPELRRIRSGDEPPAEGEIELSQCTMHWLHLPVMSGEAIVGRLVMLRDVTDERAVERLREDMVSTMVHDLRNPLGAVSTAVEYVKLDDGGHLAPDQREALEVAYNSTQRVLGLVNSILEINQLEAGRMPLHYTSVPLDALVSETLRAQSSLAANKHIQLEGAVPADLPPAWADVELVRRVFQNLVDNAIKFTPPGGRVHVAARLVSGGAQATIQVSVSDTGSGIPLAIRDKLFQKFITGRQIGRGSGLGLAFCRLVLEAHGQRIWVESDPAAGAGTTFLFTLATAPEADFFVFDQLATLDLA